MEAEDDDNYEKASDSPEKSRIDEIGNTSSVAKERRLYYNDFNTKELQKIRATLAVATVIFSLLYCFTRYEGTEPDGEENQYTKYHMKINLTIYEIILGTCAFVLIKDGIYSCC